MDEVLVRGFSAGSTPLVSSAQATDVLSDADSAVTPLSDNSKDIERVLVDGH